MYVYIYIYIYIYVYIHKLIYLTFGSLVQQRTAQVSR